MYCCWLPPQPCTNSTPGTSIEGATTVPWIVSPSTAMETTSSCVDMRRGNNVLGQRTNLRVHTVKKYGRPGWRREFGAVHFHGRRPRLNQSAVLAEHGERGHFRPAGPTDAPRLLQHSDPPASANIGPGDHVVVAARREESGEAFRGRGVVNARADDGEFHFGVVGGAGERVEIAADRGQVRAAVDFGAMVVAR